MLMGWIPIATYTILLNLLESLSLVPPPSFFQECEAVVDRLFDLGIREQHNDIHLCLDKTFYPGISFLVRVLSQVVDTNDLIVSKLYRRILYNG